MSVRSKKLPVNVYTDELVEQAIERAIQRMKLQGSIRIEQGRALGCVPLPLTQEILGISRARVYVLNGKGRLS